jgi:3-methyladenine DNA glycosylase Tag
MSPTHEANRPSSLAGYLETMSRIVFASGMSWRVVEAKWDGIRAGFCDFEPARVAALTPADVDRLAADPAVIRNRKKIEATIHNAAVMLELDSRQGGFAGYLASRGGFEKTAAELRRDFRFLGESGVYYFLWAVAEPVPAYEEWRASHRRRSVA